MDSLFQEINYEAFARFKQLGAIKSEVFVYGMVGVIGMGAELLLRPSPRLLVMFCGRV
jgi:hypothetical protein